MGDDQAQKQLPSTLFLKLLQLTIANVDRYEPWDQASLVRIAQYHLEDAQSLPLDDGEPRSICSYHSPQPARGSLSHPLALLLPLLAFSLILSAFLPFSFLFNPTSPD